MAKNISNTKKQKIIDLYKNGYSYKDIQKIVGTTSSTIGRLVGGIRSVREGVILARSRGKCVLTDDGRKKLSENGKKSCQRSGKIWTKPEREFKNILNELNIGVSFPYHIREMFELDNDNNATVCFQYPIQRYVCDFVDVNSKIIYMINGDFWHANPLLYSDEKLTKIQQHNIRQDKNRKIYLEKHGWKICNLWESEIYWNRELVKEKIRACSSTVERIVYTDEVAGSTPAMPIDWSENIKKLWFKKPKKVSEKLNKKCGLCDTLFQVSLENKKAINRKFCSVFCSKKFNAKVKNRPTKEQLIEMIDSMSWCEIGRKYGVSDNAIRKWARKFSLISNKEK